jgi:uncharacterized protein (TIGR03083 family)
MEPGNHKQELLHLIRTEHDALDATVAPLAVEQLTAPSLADGWSVKDVLAHITWWEQQMLLKLRGVHMELHREDEEWAETIKRVNAQVFEDLHARPLPDVLTAYGRSYAEVLAAVEALEEADLADLDLWNHIACDSYEHYAEHLQDLRRVLTATPVALQAD